MEAARWARPTRRDHDLPWAAHASWSLLNAVRATFSGIGYGSATLLTRSLWAGILAHALYNRATAIG
ncbi:CPBP family intramembrane glutamic endopeptidase [Microbacterium sp. CGR1]|uniref:CPBP family intramembrane glutamic endopeptidase n=1 Tax=Microbacterium sp. CGR1 TaxID=1696072 RepID=UPI003DA51803